MTLSATCCFHQPSIWNIRSEGYQRASFRHLALPSPEDDFLHPLKATSAGGSGSLFFSPWRLNSGLDNDFFPSQIFFFFFYKDVHRCFVMHYYCPKIFFFSCQHWPSCCTVATSLSARWLVNTPNACMKKCSPLNLLSLCQLDGLIPTLVFPIHAESF